MVLLIFSFLFSPTSQSANCPVGECSYYSCLAQQLNCDSRNYLKTKGEYYCEAFQAESFLFTSSGQEFLLKLRWCLQEKFKKEATPTCENAQELALEHHFQCYIENNYCALSALDQLEIARIVSWELLFNPPYRETALRISRSCSALERPL